MYTDRAWQCRDNLAQKPDDISHLLSISFKKLSLGFPEGFKQDYALASFEFFTQGGAGSNRPSGLCWWQPGSFPTTFLFYG